jgi:hypothetical protein
MKSQCCEVILRWIDNRQPVYCGQIAESRYPAMGGGYMYLCAEHQGPHLGYVEKLDGQP